MSKTPFMPLWVSDFLGDTMDLGASEIGAYMLLLMAQWNRDGESLPNDSEKLKRICRCGRSWPKVWGVIERFFQTDENGIYSKRLRLEAASVAAKREVNAHNGARGGKAKSLKSKNMPLANATVSPERNPSIPEPYIEKEEGKPSSKKARASRLGDDWFLPQQWGEWAITEGCTVGQTRSESEKFKDYWHSKAGPTAAKLDWQATWRNWVRTAIERTHKPKAFNGGPHDASNSNQNGTQGRGNGPNAAIEQIARLAGLSAASGDGGCGVGSFSQEDGSLWLGTRPQ